MANTQNAVSNLVVVGISEMIVSRDADATLVTYSLGSCLGVTVFDPVAGVGGIIHCMLPLSSVDPAKAQKTPGMFVDKGIPAFLTELMGAGATKGNMVLKAAGCAQLLDPNGRFKIGERNFTILRKLLWKNNMLMKRHQIGGNVSRTLSLEIGTGRTFIKSDGVVTEL